MSDATNERPGEAGSHGAFDIGNGTALAVYRGPQTGSERPLDPQERLIWKLQADCERWSGLYAKGQDELVRLENLLHEHALIVGHLTRERGTLTDRLAEVEQGKTCPRCDVDGYWFKATKVAETRVKELEGQLNHALIIPSEPEVDVDFEPDDTTPPAAGELGGNHELDS